VTHVVGEAMVKGNLKDAALIYIARPFPDETEEIRQARKYVQDTGDFKAGSKMYPLRLQFERAMMSHLIAHPDDHAGAFRAFCPESSKDVPACVSIIYIQYHP